jgi:hypothetical protein
VSRTIAINDRPASRPQIRLPARDLIACGAWQTGAPAMTGAGVVARIAPRFIRMILANPPGTAAELAFHTHFIFDETPEQISPVR